MMRITDDIPPKEFKSSYVELYTGAHMKAGTLTSVYPCDGEFVEDGAEGSKESKSESKSAQTARRYREIMKPENNIHNESGAAFRKTKSQGIRRESGTTPGGGKYDMMSIDDAPAFKKKLAELMKANPKAAMELKRVGIIIDEYSALKEADSYVSEGEVPLDWPHGGLEFPKGVSKAEAKAAMDMAEKQIDRLPFIGKPGNPHWCQLCGRIHCPEAGIIPGNPEKAGKPIRCPAGVPWDDTPYTGIHSSSCDFWVPSDLHAGDYRCPECHAVLIETTPGELNTMPVCPTCDVAAGYIDMSKIHDESNPFVPPEPYVEDEENAAPSEIKPEAEQPFSLAALLSTLLPCPECKSIKVLELQSNQTSGAHNVFCQMCAYVGPMGKDEKEAINLWNEIDRSEE